MNLWWEFKWYLALMPLIYLVGHFVVGMHESGWSSSYQQQPQSFNKNLRLLVLVVTCLLSHFVGVQRVPARWLVSIWNYFSFWKFENTIFYFELWTLYPLSSFLPSSWRMAKFNCQQTKTENRQFSKQATAYRKIVRPPSVGCIHSTINHQPSKINQHDSDI